MKEQQTFLDKSLSLWSKFHSQCGVFEDWLSRAEEIVTRDSYGYTLKETEDYCSTIKVSVTFTAKVDVCNFCIQLFNLCDKFMQIHQNGPLDKFMRLLFMCSSTLCIVSYGAIKLCGTNLCDLRLIHRNTYDVTHKNVSLWYRVFCIIVFKPWEFASPIPHLS